MQILCIGDVVGSRGCNFLRRTLPALRHDERKPEDAAVTPHELTHAPDALRGFGARRASTS